MLGRKGRRGGIARSVATTHALDAIAREFGVPLYETPVGFKYIGEKLIAGEIIFGGEESAGLTVEGHVPEKDGILADLLVGGDGRGDGQDHGRARPRSSKREIGVFRSRRVDLALSRRGAEALERPPSAPRRKCSRGREGGVGQRASTELKLLFEDGSWILVRESGTEPVARVYVEARSAADATPSCRRARRYWPTVCSRA